MKVGIFSIEQIGYNLIRVETDIGWTRPLLARKIDGQWQGKFEDRPGDYVDDWHNFLPVSDGSIRYTPNAILAWESMQDKDIEVQEESIY